MACKPKREGGITIVDPNGCGPVNHEDLMIYVKLVAHTKTRSILSNNNEGRSIVLENVMQNSPNGRNITHPNNAKFITTDWTNIGGGVLKGGEDVGGFGISDINIEFKSSFMPIISINFIDVRGATLFEQGPCSPYSAFFHMPYPVFELTVKGFYGKPVSFTLALQKFQTKFNSSTGNFEIKCDFVGYTYAFLADIVMGYALAAPYMEGGRQTLQGVWDSIIAKRISTYPDEKNKLPTQSKTLKDLLADILKLEQVVGELVGTKEFTIIENLNNIKDQLNGLNEELNKYRAAVIEKGGELKTSRYKDLQQNMVKCEDSNLTAIKSLTEDFFGKNGSDEETGSYQILVSFINREINEKELGITKLETLNADLLKYGNGIYGPKSSGENFLDIGLACLQKSDAVLLEVTKLLEEKEDKAKELINSAAEQTLGYVPTIQNVFSVIMANVETFLLLFRGSSKKAEDVHNSQNLETTVLSDGRKTTQKTIYPWPTYFEPNPEQRATQDSNGNTIYESLGSVEKYPGHKKQTTLDIYSWEEVRFVEDFIRAYIEVNEAIQVLMGDVEGVPGYFRYIPINPIESPAWDSLGASPNGYLGVLDKEEILRRVGRRAFIVGDHTMINGLTAWKSRMGIFDDGIDTTSNDSVTNSPLSNYVTELTTGNRGLPTDETFDVGYTDGYATYTLFPLITNNKQMKTFGYIDGMNCVNAQFGDKGVTKLYHLKNITTQGKEDALKSEILNLLGDEILQSSFNDWVTVNGVGLTPTQVKDALINIDKGYDTINTSTIYTYNKDVIQLNDTKQIHYNPHLSVSLSLLDTPYTRKIEFDKLNDKQKDSIVKKEKDDLNISDVNYKGLLKNDASGLFSYNAGTTSGLYHHLNIQHTDGDSNDYGFLSRSTESGNPHLKNEFYRTAFFEIDPFDSNDVTYTIGAISQLGNNVYAVVDFGPPWQVQKGNGDALIQTPWWAANLPNNKNYKYPVGLGKDKGTKNVHARYGTNGTEFVFPKMIANLYLSDGWIWDSENPHIGRYGYLTQAEKEDISIQPSNIWDDPESVEGFDVTSDWKVYGPVYSSTGLPNPNGTVGQDYPNKIPGFQSNNLTSARALAYITLMTLGEEDVLGYGGITPWFDIIVNAHNYLGAGAITGNGTRLWSAYFRTIAAEYEIPKCVMLQTGAVLWRMRQAGYLPNNPSTNGNVDPVFWMNVYDEKIIKDKSGTSFKEFKPYHWPISDAVLRQDFKVGEMNYNTRSVGNMKFIDSSSVYNYMDTRMYAKGLINLSAEQQNIFIDQFLNFAENEFKDNYLPGLDPINFKEGENFFSYYGVDVGGAWQDRVGIKNGDGGVNETIKSLYEYLFGETSSFNLPTDLGGGSNGVSKLVTSTPKTFYGIDVNDFHRFSITKNEFDAYVEGWAKGVRLTIDNRINEISEGGEDEISDARKAFDDDDVKLNLYRSFRSIYDKWIASSDSTDDLKLFYNANKKSDNRLLLEHFRFVNRAMYNIGDSSVIDVTHLKTIAEDPTISLYQYVSNILSKNNYDFFPLPTWTDFGKPGGFAEDMFTAVDVISEIESSPSFICMFIGGNSRNIAMGQLYATCDENNRPRYDYEDDGFKISDVTTRPTDLAGSTAFLVRYGDENQSHFKSIALDQAEFKETQESLMVIDKLAKGGNKSNNSSKGQNLYNMYLTRSYSCEVETFGNLQIQPMMYFELSNVPMFFGTYLITEVRHNITPHNAKTTFKGVRVPRITVPLVTDAYTAMNLSESEINQKETTAQAVFNKNGLSMPSGGGPGTSSNTSTGTGNSGVIYKPVKIVNSTNNIVNLIQKNGGYNGSVDSKQVKSNNPIKLVKVLPNNELKLATGSIISYNDCSGNCQLMIEEAVAPFIQMLTDLDKYIMGLGTYSSHKMYLNGGYRDIDKQNQLCHHRDSSGKCTTKSGNRAAEPGTSNHGWGVGMDWKWSLPDGSFEDANSACKYYDPNAGRWLSEQYRWLYQNAPNYGFAQEAGLKDGSGSDEVWHWVYYGTGSYDFMVKNPVSRGCKRVDLTWDSTKFKLHPTVKNPIDLETGKPAVIGSKTATTPVTQSSSELDEQSQSGGFAGGGGSFF